MGRDIKNEVSFSFSSAHLLNECEFRFYLTKYQSWEGWWSFDRPPASKEAEEAYWAKHMQTVPQLVGDVVHKALEHTLTLARSTKRWLVNGPVLSPEDTAKTRDEAFEFARSWIAQTVVRMVENATLGRGTNAKTTNRLFEVEIEGKTVHSADLIEECTEKLASFMSSEWRTDTGNQTPNLLVAALMRSEAIIAVEDRLWFTVNGVKVNMVADLIMRSRDRKSVTIFDWKTGKYKDEHVGQAFHYAAWGHARNFYEVRTHFVYSMPPDSAVEFRLSPSIEGSISKINRDVADYVRVLSAKLVDGDISKNVPLGPDVFKVTDNPKFCRSCTFQRMCRAAGRMPTESIDRQAMPGGPK